ncbi:phosphotransferase family protein [Cohnella yongneupensis]|uniref:Phosphotransferase family protein n=1 Tax=Cohnella yongneupensis TaxID=425006 RepID=A0ABW0QZ89_9BACL
MRLPQGWLEESVYVAMDGRNVSRIRAPDGRRFIRKPVPADSAERWIYENVLSGLPVHYPRLLESPVAGGEAVESLWFEDLGALTHNYDLSLALRVVRYVAYWHNYATEPGRLASLCGLKPTYDQMANEVLAMQRLLTGMADKHGIDRSRLARFYREIEETRLTDAPVLSHGDLHVGNYACVNGQTYVLDWEHAHLNVRYWDLFHLIDLTHPLYPRSVSPEWRETLLRAYYDESERLGLPVDRITFELEYRLFAGVFSLWMLGLIEQDLLNPDCVWPKSRLQTQASETADIIGQII